MSSIPPVGGSRMHLPVNSDLPPASSSSNPPPPSLEGRQVSPIDLNSGSVEGAGIVPTPPRDDPEVNADRLAQYRAKARESRRRRDIPDAASARRDIPAQPNGGDEQVGAEDRARSKAKAREIFGRAEDIPDAANARDIPPPAPPPAGGDGWRFWRWIGKDRPRPAAPPPPASADGPPPNWIDWMRSPMSPPIPPKAPQPKLGLADFPSQPKKDDLVKAKSDKAECLKPLPDLFMYRETLLKSIQSALRANKDKPELLDENKSEFDRAMKQELAYKELCEFCLKEYTWKLWPVSPDEQKPTEKLHEECIKKQGDLDRLEAALLAELQKTRLYSRPKTPDKPAAPDEPLVKKVVDFLAKHPWLTAGAVGSFAFAVRDLSWMPVAAPIAVGIAIDGAGQPQELAKDIKEMAKTVFKSSPSAALPIGAAIATTAYLNDCDHLIGLGGYNFLTPGQLFGLAGLTNLIAISNFMEGVCWVCDELPSICSEKISRVPYIVFRGGYRTGIASAALGGALSNYFDASKTVTGSFMALIWATHVAASYAIYQSELRNAAV